MGSIIMAKRFSNVQSVLKSAEKKATPLTFVEKNAMAWKLVKSGKASNLKEAWSIIKSNKSN